MQREERGEKEEGTEGENRNRSMGGMEAGEKRR